uniref:Peptidase_M43 domain-containing protein n=1 Tax=Ascaris lumbricoides TaxID=6252 RepID=A0A0M3HG95_ASCLU
MSNCLPAGASINDWNYAGKLWNITGTSDASFTACLLSAIKYVNETAVRKVPELNEHDLYVFSYFYDRGVQGDLVPRTVDNRGGESTRVHFRRNNLALSTGSHGNVSICHTYMHFFGMAMGWTTTSKSL